MNRSKVGQSAMEYLMTYGWALLVIVIVIAVLMYLRPFGAPESCIFQSPGFSCQNQRVSAIGDLYAQIVNGNQKTIEVTGLACGQGYTQPPINPVSTGYLGQGQPFIISPSDIPVSCSSTPMTPGDEFSGRLYVQYRYTDDPSTFPDKIAVATITGPVQQP